MFVIQNTVNNPTVSIEVLTTLHLNRLNNTAGWSPVSPFYRFDHRKQQKPSQIEDISRTEYKYTKCVF